MSDNARLTRDAEPSPVTTELHIARRELKWVLTEHEHQAETLQRIRRQRARLREQVQTLSDVLAATLSERYWAAQPEGSGLGRLLGRSGHRDPEAELVREVEASDQFDGGWYLRTHPKAARSGLSPALHYVRHGNAKRLDPGPGFSTSSYLTRHPEAESGDLPALLHALRHGELAKPTADDAASPASDLHL